MLKSLNQWCFPDGTPLETIFAVSRDAGYDAVELNVYAEGGIGLTLESTRSEVEAIGELAKRHGLQLRSLSTGLMWGNSLSSSEAEVRERGRNVVRTQLRFAQWLGIDTVLVVPGFVTAATSYEECYERSQAELRELVKDAAESGVRIGVENVWNKFLLSPLEMARYIDELDSAFVGAYFDVGNVLAFGFPEQWIRILGKRILKVHVKDFVTGVGTGHGFVPLLAGNVNWPAVREALESVGYADTLTAEVSPYGSDPHQIAYDTSRHLDVIIGGKGG